MTGPPPRALVIGAYGFIGLAVADALAAHGWRVRGLGRDAAHGARVAPEIEWIAGDLRHMTRPEDWRAPLAGVEAVINAAGALQDGAGDDVAAVQAGAASACWAACAEAGVARVVQVSAVGADPAHPTAFLRTKAEADRALRESGLAHAILRPGLVIGAEAYGGTALLRGIAAFPLVQPIVFAGAPIQTVALEDVAQAAADAAEGAFGPAFEADLVEPTPRALAETVAFLRAWLGIPPASRILRLPDGLARLAARAGDALGWLGWRPPLRSTAVAVLAGGVAGDPGPWRAASGGDVASLPETLARRRATRADRLAARMFLLTPLIVAALAAFWIVSGLVGLAERGAASDVLASRGVPSAPALAAAIAGAAVDIALGLAILWRRAARAACLAMIAVTAAYLAAATFLAPDLWADPLGPLVKAAPAAVLALAALPLLARR